MKIDFEIMFSIDADNYCSINSMSKADIRDERVNYDRQDAIVEGVLDIGVKNALMEAFERPAEQSIIEITKENLEQDFHYWSQACYKTALSYVDEHARIVSIEPSIESLKVFLEYCNYHDIEIDGDLHGLKEVEIQGHNDKNSDFIWCSAKPEEKNE